MVCRMFAPGWRRMIISTARCAVDPGGQAVVLDVVEDVAPRRPAARRAALRRRRSGCGRRPRPTAGRWPRGCTDCSVPVSAPLGWLAVEPASAARTSSSDSPRPASASGSTCTRTAGCCPPPTNTWPTPSTWDDLLGQHAVGGVEHLRQRQRFGRQRQDQDRRVGRVDLAVVGAAGQVGRQLGPRRVDGRLNVARGGRHVAVQIELQRDRGGAQRADGRHLA